MNGKKVAVAVGLLFLIACGSPETDPTRHASSNEDPGYVQLSAAKLGPGDPIPAPTDDVILTISGDLGASVAEGGLELDMKTLESMGLVEYDVVDPWDKKRVRYSGVLLSQLLDTVGVPASAKTLRLRALDDYEVSIQIADARRWPIMLATRSGGAPMAVEAGGPSRIVFPYDDYPEIDRVAYKELWIWNVLTMAVI